MTVNRGDGKRGTGGMNIVINNGRHSLSLCQSRPMRRFGGRAKKFRHRDPLCTPESGGCLEWQTCFLTYASGIREEQYGGLWRDGEFSRMVRAVDRSAERAYRVNGPAPHPASFADPNPAVLDDENKVGFSRRPNFRDFSSWSAIGRTNRNPRQRSPLGRSDTPRTVRATDGPAPG